jgi:hypothetical protein
MTRTILRLLAVPWMLCIAAAASQAADIVILTPRNQETIHDNSGKVGVTVQAQLGPRQQIRLLLDGRPAGPASNQRSFTLEDIDRGEHTLQALLVNDKDAVLATSAAVTFYLWRASAQFPARKPKPKPPPSAPPAKP